MMTDTPKPYTVEDVLNELEDHAFGDAGASRQVRADFPVYVRIGIFLHRLEHIESNRQAVLLVVGERID